MSFLNKYNGTADARLLRLERLTWLLIYGGLMALLLGYFMAQGQAASASAYYAGGALAVGLGLVLIYLRSRMTERA